MENISSRLTLSIKIFLLACLTSLSLGTFATVFTINSSTPRTIFPTTLGGVPKGGDTIKVLSSRTLGMNFYNISGSPSAPIVIINSGGRVLINDTLIQVAIGFSNCRYIKVSGSGVNALRYGFSLRGALAGLSFAEMSSDCEAEYLEVQNSGFFGIVAKKDFGGNPPTPYPQFENLIVHDNYVHHVSEGVYIGETMSPGMEFRHVRVYNNVITDCNREAIQFANCVEDVEAYNNFCSNTGLKGLYAQVGSIQIGDNTVGRFYNNVLMNCPGYGFPVFGSGDIEIFNNFVENTSGIFIDERTFNTLPSSISVTGNLFYNTITAPIITSMNGVNEMHIKSNIYNTSGIFAKNTENAVPLWQETGNTQQTIDSVHYTLLDGQFAHLPSNPAIYNGIGPKIGLSHTMNPKPTFIPVDDQYILFGDSLNLTIKANTTDNDLLSFEVRNLPSCITWQRKGNGQIVFKGLSNNASKGVYYPIVMVHDGSNNAISRLKFKIAFKNPSNSPPVLSLNNNYSVEATTKQSLNITAADADNDQTTYIFYDLPPFISKVQASNSNFLEIKPLLANIGNYLFMVVADDGYGHPDTANISLEITVAVLLPGKLLYRLNCGGPEIADVPMNWQSDVDRVTVYGVGMAYGTGSYSWSGTNVTGAPNNVFGPFRHCYADSSFRYHFPVPTNGKYEVHLLFAERSNEVNAGKSETFSVTIEDSVALNAYNVYKESGYRAVRKTFVTNVYDQAIDLVFRAQLNDAKINGIEIKFLQAANNPPKISTIVDQVINEGLKDTLIFTVMDDLFLGCGPLNVSLINAPSFVNLQKNGNVYYLICQPGFNDAGTYKSISVKSTDGCAIVVQNFNITVNDVFVNHPPVLLVPTSLTTNEGQTANYLVSATDADNQALTFAFTGLPSFMQFVTTGPGTGKLVAIPGYNDSGTYPIVVEVSDTYRATDKDTLILTVVNSPTVERIPLKASMVTDLVRPPIGSTASGSFLVDEQNLSPELKQHPVSASWKPYYNMNYAPYHIYLDLGREYMITKLYIHDMNNVADLDFSYGVPGNWVSWFTEPCNSYNNWKLHETGVATRYIRLTMYSSVYAAINELALYGYAMGLKSLAIGGISDIKLPEANPIGIRVWPNPATTELNILGMPKNANASIYTMNGEIVLQSAYSELNVSVLKPSTYIMIIKNENGEAIFSTRIAIK